MSHTTMLGWVMTVCLLATALPVRAQRMAAADDYSGEGRFSVALQGLRSDQEYEAACGAGCAALVRNDRDALRIALGWRFHRNWTAELRAGRERWTRRGLGHFGDDVVHDYRPTYGVALLGTVFSKGVFSTGPVVSYDRGSSTAFREQYLVPIFSGPFVTTEYHFGAPTDFAAGWSFEARVKRVRLHGGPLHVNSRYTLRRRITRDYSVPTVYTTVEESGETVRNDARNGAWGGVSVRLGRGFALHAEARALGVATFAAGLSWTIH